MFGTPKKCKRCNKTVYHAEQKLAEGDAWHNGCWAMEFKEREKAKKEQKDSVSYTRPADVQPTYYRVADVDSGVPARMEASVKEPVVVQSTPQPQISQPAPQPSQSAPVSNAPNFCPECGTKRAENDRFCANCGFKLF